MARQRGRKSAASLTVVPFVEQPKPDAPKHLSAEQKQIWRDIVDAMVPSHFPAATYPLLEVYCTCVARCRAIERLLRQADPKADFKKYRMLVTMQCQQSALLCSLSTRLRLLKPSSSRQDRHEPPGPKPWELHRPWDDDPPEDTPA